MKILVISSNLIGDNVLSTGAIQFFLEKYSDSKFTFLVGPTAHQLYENFPNVENKIIIAKRKYNLHWLEIFKNCFFNKWDIIIDFRSSLISYLLFHKKKFIFKKNKNYHHLDQLKKLFMFDCSNLIIHNNFKENQIANSKLEDQYQYVVLCPGGNWLPKLWPINKFNELMKLISINYKNVKYIVVGSVNEKKTYYEQLIQDISKKDIIDIMGESLTQTSAYMKKSNLFIGNDSGLMHLSVASKIKTIGLFGPTNDKIYGPKGKKCFVIRTKENYEILSKNIIDQSINYMDSIQVKDVMDLIMKEKLLNE